MNEQEEQGRAGKSRKNERVGKSRKEQEGEEGEEGEEGGEDMGREELRICDDGGICRQQDVGNVSGYRRIWGGLLLILLLAVDMCSGHPAYASEDGWRRAMMYISGVSDVEDIDEYTAEEFSAFLTSPLKINMASVSRLTQSGLLSQYQTASLLDYRQRAGDILSLSELAAIDGFGEEYAKALSWFISLESSAAPGRSSAYAGRIGNSLVLRSSARKKEQEDNIESSHAFKYRLDIRDRVEACVGGKYAYGAGDISPEVLSFNVTYYGRKVLGKVIAGDFNARFGQGLAMWSGFSMGGLAAPESYSRRPSGISPYRSWSGDGTFRGLAADFSFGKLVLTAFLAADGLRELMGSNDSQSVSLVPAVNVGYFGRNGQASFTCYAQTQDVMSPLHSGGGRFMESSFSDLKCSADMRYTIRGTEVFSEVALDVMSMSVAALAGTRFKAGEHLDMAVSGRYYPAGYSASRSGAVRSDTKCTNEYAVSAGGSFSAGDYVPLAGKEGFGSSVLRHRGVFSVDLSHAPEPRYGTDGPTSQLKLLVDYDLQLTGEVSVSCRVSQRLRTWGEPSRTDVRTDFLYSDGRFSIAARFNLLQCKGTGLLSYVEGGYRDGRYSAFLRGGVFKVDNWDDRIYAYERDAPGSFNVPAYYGRGYWTALYAGARCTSWLKVWLRASFQDCPWLSPGAEERRPGKAEVKLQLQFTL